MSDVGDDIGPILREIELDRVINTGPILGSLESEVETSTEEDQIELVTTLESDTPKAQRLELLRHLARKYGLLKTRSERMQHGEIGIETTKNENGLRSNIEGSAPNMEVRSPEILPSSEVLSGSLENKLSDSMSLLDDTAKHLHTLMKGMTANKPPAEIRVVDPEIMNAAATAANAIYKIKRLKLDAIKMMKDIK